MYAVISNNQRLEDLTPTEKREIKESLTYENPKYKLAKKFGRGRYTTVPPYLKYYKDIDENTLEVPFGYSFPCDKFHIITKRFEVDYPRICIELRDDQKKAYFGFMNHKRHKNRPSNYGIIQLPTGKGKSVLGIYMSYVFRQKTLIIVHKDDLVVGWKKDIAMCFDNKVTVGLIKAKSRTVGEQFTIATAQTLSRMATSELESYTSQFGMIIMDEVHHIGSNSFNIVDKFNAYYKIGLSATPKRTDGLNQCFNLFFGGIVYEHEYSKDDKDILPVKVIVKESRAKYRPFVVRNDRGEYATDQFFNLYDYKASELPSDFKSVDSFDYKDKPRVPYLVTDNAVVLDRRFKIMVCKDIIKEVRERHSCLALFTQKEHINQYYSYLSRFIPKEKIALFYGDSKEKTEDFMKRAESREVFITLGTLAKATEGTNVKAWEVLFLVSSMNNEKNVEQATGRIRRSLDGKLNPVVVYDYEHPCVTGIQSHFTTRKKVYQRLKYDIEYDGKSLPSKKPVFSRGY